MDGPGVRTSSNLKSRSTYNQELSLPALPDSDGQPPLSAYDVPFNPNPPQRYDAFLGFSHRKDWLLARYICTALKHFVTTTDGRRLQPRVYVFPTIDNAPSAKTLLQPICDAIDGSDRFMLLASEESADSHWVGREVARWLTYKSADRLLMVRTGGTLLWDPAASDFDFDRSSAIHPRLRGAFVQPPPIFEMTWTPAQHGSVSIDRRFCALLADIAATLLGLPREEIRASPPDDGSWNGRL
jgi:hypothetical protein